MIDLLYSFVALAQEAGAQKPQASFFEMMALPLGIFAIMYFFMIRPQQKKMKQHQSLITNLKVGDEVVTNAGIIGRIRSIADHFVTLEIAANTNVKFLKHHVAELTKKPGAEKDKK